MTKQQKVPAMAGLTSERKDVQPGQGGPFRPAGKTHTREADVLEGRSRKPKHKKDLRDVEAE